MPDYDDEDVIETIIPEYETPDIKVEDTINAVPEEVVKDPLHYCRDRSKCSLKAKGNGSIMSSISKAGSTIYNRIRDVINVPMLCGETSKKGRKKSKRPSPCCLNDGKC